MLPVSYDRYKLENIAGIIKLKKGTKDWMEFIDLASISQQKIPYDIYSDEEVLKMLPVFLSTLRGKKLDKVELKKLFKILKWR